MLKLKLQYFGHLMQRADSLEKTLIEGRRRRGLHRVRWLDGITDSVDIEQTPGDSKGQGSLACCSPWGSQTPGHDLATEQQHQQKGETDVGLRPVTAVPPLPSGQEL